MGLLQQLPRQLPLLAQHLDMADHYVLTAVIAACAFKHVREADNRRVAIPRITHPHRRPRVTLLVRRQHQQVIEGQLHLMTRRGESFTHTRDSRAPSRPRLGPGWLRKIKRQAIPGLPGQRRLDPTS
jgi:hypothetical protein